MGPRSAGRNPASARRPAAQFGPARSSPEQPLYCAYSNNPALSPRAEHPLRRADLSDHIRRPSRFDHTLIVEIDDWADGVFFGASMGSETTAAATGQVGIVRRDPMAMFPFCGYNIVNYFGHWHEMERK